MLLSSCGSKEKQVIKVHFILSLEPISFKLQKVIVILPYSLIFMSSNAVVTKIHKLHKFGVILVKQYQVMELFVGDLRLILKSQ